MKRERILFVAGLLVVLSPFYGLPEKATEIITVLLGVAIMILSRIKPAAADSTPEVSAVNTDTSAA